MSKQTQTKTPTKPKRKKSMTLAERIEQSERERVERELYWRGMEKRMSDTLNGLAAAVGSSRKASARNK